MARVQASLLAVAVMVAAATASGASYTVGEPGGSWDQQTNLTAWASSIDFETGDQLGMSSSSLPVSLKPIRVQFHTEQCMLFSRASAVFKYSAAAHDVVEVSRSGYRSCSAESPKATFRTGNDAVQLDGLRVRYFICGVPGHCAAGMKLEVSVRPAG
jgi:hypothetical protein